MRPTRRELLKAAGLATAGAALPLPAVLATAGQSSAATPLRFGANGHPYNTKAYDADAEPGVPYATQVAMLTAMGMDVYRTDIKTDAAGRSTNHTKFLTMQGLLADAGIDCLPMVYDNYSPDISPQENYDRGYALMAGFATDYGHMFTHYNLGNEWELFKKLLLSPDGEVAGDFDLPKCERAMNWIKGANAGLKSVRPTAKTSVSVSGYFPIWWQGYVLDNVDLDFIDWHWYAEMQRGIAGLPVSGITNVFDWLWSEYGLPIWVAETNERPSQTRSDAENQQRQVNWYHQIRAICEAHPHVEALVLYELLTQPVRTDSYTEANYGLVSFPNFDPVTMDHTDWSYKKLPRRIIGADVVIGGFEGPSEGWALGLGPEFPGATGTFQRNDTYVMGGALAGVLHGDFTGGGNYVQISRPVSGLALRKLTFWVRATTVQRVGLRVTDSTGQTHQQNLAFTPSGAWQEIVVSDFDSGAGYLHFGGADDGVWHGPATRVALVLDKSGLVSGQTGGVRFDEVVATVQDVP
ncbi:glycosyl hydrolase [Jiangella sp. DSM 45060]|uniref:glycosyl hydrolase n=1 Tax=Jiangella sp. DSM 45060 TaxID=1798224 RepID=UPI00087BBE2E|nr:glycosyl hydrolase [Jiangella sp. DSM 45060]SDS46408.1 Glycosyl hydrolase catalytic core [Jiangella sp. DSM 45060]